MASKARCGAEDCRKFGRKLGAMCFRHPIVPLPNLQHAGYSVELYPACCTKNLNYKSLYGISIIYRISNLKILQNYDRYTIIFWRLSKISSFVDAKVNHILQYFKQISNNEVISLTCMNGGTWLGIS